MHGKKADFLEPVIKNLAENLDGFGCGYIICRQKDKIHLLEYKNGKKVRVVLQDVLSLPKIENRAKMNRIKYVASAIEKIRKTTAPIVFMEKSLVEFICR